MKLSHLYEAVDARKLLTGAAHELGLDNPQFYDIDDDTSNAADVQAGIDLFHLHLDTEGSADVSGRLRRIESMASRYLNVQDEEGKEALDYFEGTSFDNLPSVSSFVQSLAALKASAARAKESAATAFKTYFLLSALNTAAITTVSSKHTADEVRYRASIARAALKQLGITPKDL